MTREEALNIVRQMSLPKETMEILEALAPELAESEEERTRKFLVKHVSEWIGCLEHDLKISPKDVESEEELAMFKAGLAYLEKQKENPKSADSIPSDCTSDAKYEDRWHKVTDSLPDNGRLVLAKDCLGNVLLARYDGENWEVNVYDNEDHYCHNSISKWCEIPSEKQKEQKPLPPFDEMPPEEKMDHPLYLEGFDMGREVQRVFDEPSWKPSEEQMKAMSYFVRKHQATANRATTKWPEFEAFKSLYNDLKKLM